MPINPTIEPENEPQDKPDLFALEILAAAKREADGYVTNLQKGESKGEIIRRAQRWLCDYGLHIHTDPEKLCRRCWFQIVCERACLDYRWVREQMRKRYGKCR